MSSILNNMDMIYPPRYGPEWGSGGIFGLKYYRGVLYFTLAFEAIAHFIMDDGVRKYRYEYVGSLPTSGGDTYNAVETVDDEIFFGGWVHAPAVYSGRREGYRATISFVNKYSHVHKYNISEDSITLLWKEGLHHETDWVGEVSEIIYDAVNDRLLLARADGMKNLGVYQIDRKGGNYKQLSPIPAMKGSLFYDHACFDMFQDWINGVNGIQCIDLIENKVRYVKLDDVSRISIDGGGAEWRLTGTSITAYGRFFLFVRGGAFIGNPIDESIEPVKFVRLFDFGLSGYNARRTMAKPFGGGILIPYNAYTEAIIYPTNEVEERLKLATNTIVGPSILLYISPPIAKIVGAFGARITGIEVIGDKLLLAVNTMANTGRYDALPIDAGFRGFIALNHDIINKDPPSIRFKVLGIQVRGRIFGGVPLTGYREPMLKIYAKKSNKLYIYEYDLSLPLEEPKVDSYNISMGMNMVELNGYRNSIVAFKLHDEDNSSRIIIDLL